MENDIGECDGNRDYMGVGLEKEEKKLAASESPESFHASNPYTAKEMRASMQGKSYICRGSKHLMGMRILASLTNPKTLHPADSTDPAISQ